MSGKHRSDSFLRNAPALDSQFLDVNQLPVVSGSVNDEVYTIGHGFHQRPDLLADRLYGTSRLWWVFAIRNPNEIKDPIRDFKAGVRIYLPAPETVKRLAEGGAIGVS